MKTKICCICNKKYEGYGNNALSLKQGFCCDGCNLLVIIKRLRQITLNRVKGGENEKI